jgi:hypothetical protein
MNILVTEPIAKKVSFNTNNMCIDLADGRKISIPLAYFPRLLHATAKQRDSFIISGGGRGLHWEAIDEDISVKGLVMGIGDVTRTGNSSRSRKG